MVKSRSRLFKIFARSVGGLLLWAHTATGGELSLIDKVRKAADEILESAQISYVYGGSAIGSEKECKLCNDCLEQHKPSPKARFETCKDCYSCSLDCSHFVQRVFSDAGIQFPYLTTDTMRQTPANILLKRYGLIDLGRDVERAHAGDFLVYKGHVVLLERIHTLRRGGSKGLAGPRGDAVAGDIIHATGGRDIKGPGAGIQRERHVILATFRGPLMRILRHQSLYQRKMRKIRTSKFNN